MKTFHEISETLIMGTIALGSLIFVLVALGHAISHAIIAW